MLDPKWSSKRQKRLIDEISAVGLDAVVLGCPRHVYYFGAFLTGWLHQSALILFADGRSMMVTANEPAIGVAADDVVSYEAQWTATQRQEQPMVVAGVVDQALKAHRARRVGIDASLVSSQLALMTGASLMPIDPNIDQMRRVKDPDELKLLKKAIECSIAMYNRAKQIIEPGISELKIYGELHSAAIETA